MLGDFEGLIDGLRDWEIEGDILGLLLALGELEGEIDCE